MDDTQRTMMNIETARRINRSAAAKYIEHGATPIDVAIAAMYSALDIAEIATGQTGVGAVEWMRTGLDTIERQVVEQGRVA